MGSIRLELEKQRAGNWLPPPLFRKPTYKNQSSNVYTSGFATFTASVGFPQKMHSKAPIRESETYRATKDMQKEM